MENIIQTDIDTVKRLGGSLNTDESRLKLKTIYNKLEFLCNKIEQKGYVVQLRKDPRNQGGGFKYLQKYLWAKIYPKEYHKSCKDKLAFIIGVSDSIHFHIRGIKDYEGKQASEKASKQSWVNVNPLPYEELVEEFIEFDKKNRSLFIETAAKLNIDNFNEILESMNHTKIKNLLTHKNQIILQGPPGTGKTRLAKEIANTLSGNGYSKLEIEDIKKGLSIGQKIDGASGQPTYYTIEKMNESNVVLTSKDTKNKGYSAKFKKIIDYYQELVQGGVVKRKGSHDSYELAVAKHFFNKNYQLIQFHPSYTYEDFVRGITVKSEDKNISYKTENRILAQMAKDALANPSSNYILIIDEINRANLSSVLGELIYALEYRGEPVESMYEMEDEGNTIILPPNLYIIGTMNTADRSVGQIDYAIRRRFAFVDVLPKVLDESTLDNGLKFNTDKFNAVAKLFIGDNNHLSEEFNPKDVQLGHSYFIYKDGEFDLNLEYEIKPILREYVADGILKESALEVIENL